MSKGGFAVAALLRRILACFVLVSFIVLFAGLEWRFVSWITPLAKMQFFPALLALNIAVIGFVLVVTLVAGRAYCSVLCPLGLLQDVGGRLGRLARRIFRLSPPAPSRRRRAREAARMSALAVFAAAGAFGLGFSWLEPYGIFGRAFSGPVGVSVVAAILLFAVFGRGRAWCSWICPVGTLLGLLSRRAVFRPAIDGSRCIGCGKCERICKAGAIALDGSRGEIDPSLCVDCLDCMEACPKGAISFEKGGGRPADAGDGAASVTRKGFIAAAAAGATSAVLAVEDKVVDGGFAEVSPPGEDMRDPPLKPAGSRSLADFSARCVGCQLCVKACPQEVLRPSTRLRDFMQPEMAFDKGYCVMDCTRCADVCPAGAIVPLEGVRKEDVHIGCAVWHRERCLAATEGVVCTACERHCPVKAIKLVATGDGKKVPVVDELKCTGCGACEHLCPARPLPGMSVAAYARHREIRPRSGIVDVGKGRG